MKTLFILVSAMVVLFLAAPSSVVAQKTNAVTVAANKSWPKFFSEFRAAVSKRDHAALRKMISNRFDWTAEELGLSADDVLRNLDTDSHRQRGEPRMWIVLKRSLANGVKIPKWSIGGNQEPTRENRSGSYVLFRYEADGRWRWQSFLGD